GNVDAKTSSRIQDQRAFGNAGVASIDADTDLAVIGPRRSVLRHRLRSPGSGRRLHGTLSRAAVRLELVAEVLVRRHHEPGCGVTQRAEAAPVHVLADVTERGQLTRCGAARLELVHELRLAVRALHG